ncbi:OLC1v1032060C1 [Oldenlandia corymbosa var. corymbosa]|uniref:OLC1v1032060C1 n=1 Tax=Oldenlandia corymbosa var. corymbosa TaxID=529605 RepID=A0AAV1CLZ5_OLDCO|nr:OLC1v1032060C1 [Oldenlandia corymbosa var. corymbosa]
MATSSNLVGKLEGKVTLNSNPEEFFRIVGGRADQLADLINHKIPSEEHHEVDRKTEGCIKNWSYIIDGKVEVFKARLKDDEETKTVTLEALDGDCMKHYKNYVITYIVSGEDGSNVVKYSVDYEKLSENEPTPTHYLEWLGHMLKDLDASLVKP